MKNKKLVSFVVAVLMLASMAVPAQAVSGNGGKTKITGKCTLPDIQINVSVPATGKVYINPKSLPIKISGKVENGQIVTDLTYIENQSEVPVDVSVTVTGTVKSGSDMFLNATTTQGLDTTAKRAFIYFEIQAASDPGQVSWDSGYDENRHVVVRSSSKSKKNIVTLGAKDQAKQYGVFRLAGDCVENPKNEWTAKDGISVNIAFTFSPLPTTEEIP